MGDRALVVFEDGGHYSPVTYLHWSGYEVPGLLATHKELMRGREGDREYAAARFVGVCHEHLDNSNTGLGIWNLTDTERAALDTPTGDGGETKADALATLSHGDAGFILVNATTFEWRAYGGYLVSNETPYLAEEAEVE